MFKETLQNQSFSVGITTTRIAAVLAVTTAHAQTAAAVMYDANGPIALAAGDLETALAAKGCAMTATPPGNRAQANSSAHFIRSAANILTQHLLFTKSLHENKSNN